jgi:hypothetical protein
MTLLMDEPDLGTQLLGDHHSVICRVAVEQHDLGNPLRDCGENVFKVACFVLGWENNPDTDVSQQLSSQHLVLE